MLPRPCLTSTRYSHKDLSKGERDEKLRMTLHRGDDDSSSTKLFTSRLIQTKVEFHFWYLRKTSVFVLFF